MYEKTCRCGTSKKNFKIDIGPFFIGECCTEAGYDEYGKKSVELSDFSLNPDELKQMLESSETTNLQIEDDSTLDADGAEIEDTAEAEDKLKNIKKKRQYNRNGKIKVQS